MHPQVLSCIIKLVTASIHYSSAARRLHCKRRRKCAQCTEICEANCTGGNNRVRYETVGVRRIMCVSRGCGVWRVGVWGVVIGIRGTQ